MPERGTSRDNVVKGGWGSPLFLYRVGEVLFWFGGAGLRQSDIELG